MFEPSPASGQRASGPARVAAMSLDLVSFHIGLENAHHLGQSVAMLDTASPFVLDPRQPSAEARIAVAGSRLRAAIVACELAPGEFTHEAALAERYGLGRAGVRVALTRLEASGLVARHARQGWRIAPVDAAAIAATIEGRRALEPALVGRPVGRQTAARLAALAGMVASVRGRGEPSALATARAAERQAWDLVAASRGGLMRGWVADLRDHVDRIVRWLDLAGQQVPPGDLRALLAGDRADASAALAREHDAFDAALARGFLALSASLPPSAPRSARRRGAAIGRGVSHDLPKPSIKEQQR